MVMLAAFQWLLGRYAGQDDVAVGSVIAVIAWIATSALFALYTATFGSYNKTWGSLSAVIVTLTWLWLTGIALLSLGRFGSHRARSRDEQVAVSETPARPAAAPIRREEPAPIKRAA